MSTSIFKANPLHRYSLTGPLSPHSKVSDATVQWNKMAVISKPITAAERAKRTRVYEEALASVRLEGFELDERSKALYGRYIDGELTLAEVGNAIDEVNDREFGPVSVPRHNRPQKPTRSH